MKHIALGGEDAAWLHMEDATCPMVVNGLVELGGRLPLSRVTEIVAQHLDPRMRARVVEPKLRLGTPRWEEDPKFDISNHIEPVELPASTDDAALRDFIAHAVSSLLDYHKPLWRIYVIDRPGAGTALLYRIHHAVGDGFALLGSLLGMADEKAEAPALTHAVEPKGQRALEQARALALLALLPADSRTVLKNPLGTEKRAAWSESLSLDEVKEIARGVSATMAAPAAGQVTVNDVLVATVAGALRRYLVHHGGSVDDVDIRAMVPVNLRREPPTKMGNQFGLVVLTLPVREADARDRVATVKRRMDRIKSTPEAVVSYELLVGMGYVPRSVEGLGVDFFGKKASLVLTNVPGPKKQLHLGGVPIERMVFWAPQSGHMGLGISIFSYAGEVTFGVIADTNLIPDPDVLIADLHVELAALKARIRGRAATPEAHEEVASPR